MKKPCLLLLVLACVSIHFTAGSATTWYVKPDSTGDTVTIQAAIDSSAVGDTVLCAAGLYTGDGNRDLDLGGKRLVVASEDGPSVTTIDCEGSAGQPHRGFFFHSGEDSVATVDGFTITGAYSGDAGAITITASTPTIRNCIITANECDGVYCYPGFPLTGVIRIEGCKITTNTGNGVRAWGARTRIERSDVAFNELNGVSIDYSGELEMSETLVRSNGDVGLFIFTLSEYFAVTNCTFYGNRIGFFWDVNFPKGAASGAKATPDSSLVSKCIFAFNHEEGVLAYLTAPSQQIRCSNAYGNGVSDWAGSIFGAGDDHDNFSAHPLFCDVAHGDFGIDGNSPCAPANNDCGVLIGAVGVACISTGIGDGGFGTIQFGLGPNYPNPFNPSTTLIYSIPLAGWVTLRVYDVTGRLVRTAVSEPKPPGHYEAIWDGRDRNGAGVATGVYFVRLEMGGRTTTGKIALLK